MKINVHISNLREGHKGVRGQKSLSANFPKNEAISMELDLRGHDLKRPVKVDKYLDDVFWLD